MGFDDWAWLIYAWGLFTFVGFTLILAHCNHPPFLLPRRRNVNPKLSSSSSYQKTETQTHTGLRPGRCARIVVTRLLRFWEARNAKKGGELMGSSLIQASVPVHRLNTFRELLREGAMYELSGFDVSRSNNHFKLFDSVVAIWLNEFTKMVEVPAVANHIPTEMFRFRSVEQLMSLANTNVELPDIIGEVSDIRTTYNDHTQTTQRVMVNIRVDNKPFFSLAATQCVSVFYSVAELLHKRLEHGVVQPKVMVATNINPKFVGGRLYLNATSGAHFYFDNEVAESQRLFEEYLSYLSLF
ncbi:unnamed protein product [Brassica oleracea var. botrytis]|uniref:DUF223 domain-containing protein n=2 Tax=Brassica TaxID=3705 RepID=A0A3P6BRV4_BRAOL|nr:unnamed protein product [Brassica napus]VDD08847.1 unnamed protein product [Brassica oleracea]